MDIHKSVFSAFKGSQKLSKDEKTLVKAVESIALVIMDNQDVLPLKESHSVLIRLENTLKAMEDLFENAEYLLDPMLINQLKEDIAEYRRELGAGL